MSGKTIVFFMWFLGNVLLMNTVFADQSAINNMIFFGDSFSDMGNNTWIVMDGDRGAPITNSNEQDQNRKDLWVNYLVEEKLKKPVYPSSQPNLTPFNDSISYAYASTDTSDNYLNADWPQTDTPNPSINKNCTQPGEMKDTAGHTISTCIPGLLRQVNAYLDAVQHKPSSQSLFFIWAGANDLLNYYATDMASHYKLLMLFKFSVPAKAKLERVEQKAVDNIMAAKKALMDAGVKADRIYILDLPDISKTPAVLTAEDNLAFKIDHSRKGMLEKSLSDMSRDFNQKLHSQQLGEKYTIPTSHYVRIGDLFDNMLSSPTSYSLSNTSESCVDKKSAPVCKGYLFYNAKHPTTWVHKMIADTVATLLNI